MFRIISRLIEPYESVRDDPDRHKARLLTALLVFVVPVGLVATVVMQVLDGGSLVLRFVTVLGLLVLGALIPVSRGPNYRFAVLGFLLVTIPLICLVTLYASVVLAPLATAYLLVPVIVASALLGNRAAVYVLVFNGVLVLAMGQLSPWPVGILSLHLLFQLGISGGFIVIAGVFRDLLAREKQAVLAHREHRHRVLLAATFDGTADVEDGVIASVGEGFGDLFGFEGAEIVGKCLDDLFPSEPSMLASQDVLSGRGCLIELRALCKDGREVPVEAVFQGQESEGGGAVVLAVRDISARRELTARLQITDRLAAMGVLAAGVAHEINNPLTFVSGNLHRALTHLDEDVPLQVSDMRGWLTSASDGTERVGRIVRDLTTFTRESVEDSIGPFDVKEALETSVAMAMGMVKQRATFIREHESNLVAMGHSSRLGQVILNLLVNAAQALPDGPLEENQIRVSTFERDGEVVLEVYDNGPGIPPEVLPRIFEPFFTTKAVGVGTGLGLSICKNLIEGMGGVMEVETGVDGSTFRIRLKQVLGSVDRGTGALAGETRQRVLIVDDELEIARILEDILREHEVDICCDGRAALARIEVKAYDLVVCDLMMPHMTGMELFDACVRRRLLAAHRFVFLTGGSFTPLAREFLESVDCPVIQKPFRHTEILDAVSAALNGSRKIPLGATSRSEQPA